MFAIRLLCLVLIGASAALPAAADRAGAVSTVAPSAGIRVAAANVHEGILVRHRADRRDATDRRAFARRLLSRPGRLPDVVLLQETLGTAQRVGRALNAHPRAQAAGVEFVVATRTAHRVVHGACDGPRTGRFSLLRGSSILVNNRTVTQIHRRGTIRTWGRWSTRARHLTGRGGFGCTAHPWIHATIRTPGGARAALLVNAHIAPAGPRHKTRALTTLGRELADRAQRAPGTIAVLGGDLNLTRCRHDPREGERLGCAVRAGHRGLIRAGYRDAVRSLHPTGPAGVAGVARRIDFIYTLGTPTAAWYDRCYLAYFVKRWRCEAERSVFTRQRVLLRCQARSLRHGRPGDGCPPATFRRYYSDHPVLLATIT
ncbi:endonuclease/exonuclease/phosphatase family protein [Nocardioides antri]|uniref:Endonuclease/exonuclease/phosphatase domain-containing protein n=1 Tax=Nocardioides antri TaxID=2607659 RepID=A0A5B1M745_9ACTN|nr:endonuclease/exonuclease/phosphatase family protein [Nocardioides antri]KAA1428386.1 hypothetical protein F0U47_05535 [Nocardioides antri]